MTEHSINRSGRTENSTDDPDTETEADNDSQTDEQRSEAEIKRELRKSRIGQAIIDYDRRQRGRR
jgi:hypothetical protein